LANKYQQIINSNKAIQEKITYKAYKATIHKAIYRQIIEDTIGWSG
jgi:hypothetical protein